jgi:hypothetical protein
MKKIENHLHKLEEEKNEPMSSFGKTAIKVVIVSIVVVVLICFAQIEVFVVILNWLQSEVRLMTGLDAFLAKGIALILMAFVFGTPLGGSIWSFSPIPQKNKKRKRFVFLSALAALFFIIFFTSKDVYFNPETGKPIKYYSISPDGGYKISSSDGYNSITGEKLKLVNKKIATENYLGKSAQILTKGKTDGQGMYEEKYVVKFSNEQKRGIFFCFTEGHDGLSGATVIFIPTGKTISVSLTEGQHLIAFIDTEFNEHGVRDEGKILAKSHFTQDSIGKLYLKIGNHNKLIYQKFLLQVLAEKNQKVSLKEDDSLTHNMEKTEQEEDKDRITCMLLVGILIFTLSLVSFCFSIYYHSKDRWRSNLYGEIGGILFTISFFLICLSAIVLLDP